MRVLVSLLCLLGWGTLYLHAEPRKVGRCTGADPCKVCRNCSECWHCSPKNPKRGSCGVMRDQDGKAQRERDAKRERNGK